MNNIKMDNKDNSKSNVKIKPHNRKKALLKVIKTNRVNYQKEITKDVDLVFGLDNGTTGTISAWILSKNIIYFEETPSIKSLNYQQKIKYIDRIDFIKLKTWFEVIISDTKCLLNKENIKILTILERPMVNPQRFDSSLNAVRTLESCIIILDLLNIPYIIIDSKKWQHEFFGKNTLLLNLKKASQIYGEKLLETYKEFNLKTIDNMLEINKKHGDADALLITKYAIDKLLKYTKNEKE